MVSAELVIDYNVLEKPFRLIEREHHCGGTEYTTICRLSFDHARLLSQAGISWLYGEPDWEKFIRDLELHTANRERAALDKRIAALSAKGDTGRAAFKAEER